MGDMRHYTWNGSGGVELLNEKFVNGYRDVGTGEFIDFGDGTQPTNYDLTMPSYDQTIFGASQRRVNETNNSFARDMQRKTGGELGIEEGSGNRYGVGSNSATTSKYPMGVAAGRVARLVIPFSQSS